MKENNELTPFERYHELFLILFCFFICFLFFVKIVFL